MEPWTADQDRPYLRPGRGSYSWLVVALGLALAGAAAYYYLHESQRAEGDRRPLPEAPAPVEAPKPAPAEPPLRLELPQPAQPLPKLEESDSMMRESIATLVGRKAFADLFVPRELVRKIVATVDNLPRQTAPRRMVPLHPVPGAFAATPSGDGAIVDTANYQRYMPYVSVMESIDVRALVKGYVHAYPLFQRAYEELGYPGKYFNDRLMQAIDDLLAAPELDAPAKLVRPKVVFEFAEPDLETRSAGQKILMRMGKDNELRVKAKLVELRRELIAAGQRKP
ncbi:MAG: DUF3014 domain-containing protein [Betaproteobacteria bacterium]|nr:DUF3014 domain-containing protein [Betaproteobacteria bacterium]